MEVVRIYLFSLISLFFVSFSFSLELQTLILNPLPRPTHLRPNLELVTTIQTQEPSTLADNSSFTLHLEHLDTLASHLSPEKLFSLRLKRDEAQVKSIFARASNGLRPSRHGSYERKASHPQSRGSFSSSVVSGFSHGSGEYFTRLGIGTPPKYMYLVPDTGSDVNWIQCSPCIKCYNQTDRIFNPDKSTTYRSIPCESKLCHRLDQVGCLRRSNRCMYQVSYGDGSFTVGVLATETMTFHRTRLPNVALGCGHYNEGLFFGAAGLLGLGRGILSFPSQIGSKCGWKFSYCLVDRTTSLNRSWIIFGSSAVSRTAVFTPLLSNPKAETFYYVELLGFSVGGTRVPGIKRELFRIDHTGRGGVIIDSGTSVTRLIRPVYTALRDAFRAGASDLKSAPVYSIFDTCYDLSGKSEVYVPTLTMHFNGANITLPATNYLIPVDISGRFCFAFAGTTSPLSIIGNIQQQSFRVSFDTASNRVGFASNACS